MHFTSWKKSTRTEVGKAISVNADSRSWAALGSFFPWCCRYVQNTHVQALIPTSPRPRLWTPHGAHAPPLGFLHRTWMSLPPSSIQMYLPVSTGSSQTWRSKTIRFALQIWISFPSLLAADFIHITWLIEELNHDLIHYLSNNYWLSAHWGQPLSGLIGWQSPKELTAS